jgi:uracil-DNA glycosylase family 4
MDSRIKNRVRLWLRGERALGVESVQAPRASLVPEILQEAVQINEAPAPSNLFGSPEPSAASGLMPLPTAQPFVSPILPADEKRTRLEQMDANEVKGCTRCCLCERRTNTVFGEGDPNAKIVFVGEGPGENEDLQGRPFVGRAGDLLNKMIAGMGLKREQVYICNIVKCRPPGNRVPAPDEVATCTPYLERQLEIIRPQTIVTLGLPAMQYMLQTKTSMGRMRGQWQQWRGIKLMPTYHPAYVLRSYTDETRRAVWSDLQKVMVEVGLPVPKSKAAP